MSPLQAKFRFTSLRPHATLTIQLPEKGYGPGRRVQALSALKPIPAHAAERD
ncbi:hypothetical protein [Sporisorium scitamineum]|uniref:Uncharacterized protein n=1 Tax=Sporisorium scitamineum TaxID=49012 RepID=A0A0F7S8D9_9BASI|nr:hypothetical protein [Sporisorium scitamineum]